ncbi:MAG TPA: DUF4286 family protein [Gryllotalpicola sp.]
MTDETAGPRAGLMVVLIDIDPDYEDEFNRWYLEEHLPERLGLPGFRSARRFKLHEGDMATYLAIYELDSVDTVHTPEYEALFPQSPWSDEITTHFRYRVRGIYSEITPEPAAVIAARAALDERRAAQGATSN